MVQWEWPQQDPGPAQPAVEGWPPQHDPMWLSGQEEPDLPVSELVADISFSVRAEPQPGHRAGSDGVMTRTSPVYRQSRHLIS